MWAEVAGGIRTSREVFLLLFSGACKYVCAKRESHCWSKLNAEFSLFYSFGFSSPRRFGEREKETERRGEKKKQKQEEKKGPNPELKPLAPLVRFLSVGSPVQPD